jgi:hypothetical protein
MIITISIIESYLINMLRPTLIHPRTNDDVVSLDKDLH